MLVQLPALPAWLALPRDRRREIGARCLAVAGRHPRVRLRWVDVEAFTGGCSDVLIAETPEPRAWYHLFEALRDTELFTVPYFRPEQILTGIDEAAGHAG